MLEHCAIEEVLAGGGEHRVLDRPRPYQSLPDVAPAEVIDRPTHWKKANFRALQRQNARHLRYEHLATDRYTDNSPAHIENREFVGRRVFEIRTAAGTVKAAIDLASRVRPMILAFNLALCVDYNVS